MIHREGRDLRFLRQVSVFAAIAGLLKHCLT